jgi:hypothetical protein
MDDFKKLPKMQCFKTGGSVKPKAMCYGGKMKKGGEVDTADIKQDKAIVKKAFKMHDEQEHGGDHTNLSKLRKGGRAKKAVGTVQKYKAGGSVTNVYEAKKKSGDYDAIKNVKQITPTKASASSAAGKGDNTTAKFCGGKSVKKMADGGMAGQGAISNVERAAMQNALPGGTGVGSINDMERRRMMDRARNAMRYLGPQQQNEFIKQGGMNPAPTNVGAPSGSTIPAGQKRGGKVKKMADGGSLKEVDSQENPGLAKLPTNVRNKMGYMRQGGKAKKMNTGGTCS